MSVSDGPEKPAPRSVVVELARVVLHGGPQSPTRTMMQLVGRMAPFCLRAAVLILLLRGRTAVPVASQLVDLLFLLILLAAVDQWLVVPLLRGLGKLARFLAGRRGRPEALQKPPSLARLNQPPGPGAPDEEG